MASGRGRPKKRKRNKPSRLKKAAAGAQAALDIQRSLKDRDEQPASMARGAIRNPSKKLNVKRGKRRK